jgi:hypothetical protein
VLKRKWSFIGLTLYFYGKSLLEISDQQQSPTNQISEQVTTDTHSPAAGDQRPSSIPPGDSTEDENLIQF